MSEDEIRAALDAAKLRALAMLEQWGNRDSGNCWRVTQRYHDTKPYLCELVARDGDVRGFFGATQHDAMAKACEAIRGEL